MKCATDSMKEMRFYERDDHLWFMYNAPCHPSMVAPSLDEPLRVCMKSSFALTLIPVLVNVFGPCMQVSFFKCFPMARNREIKIDWFRYLSEQGNDELPLIWTARKSSHVTFLQQAGLVCLFRFFG